MNGRTIAVETRHVAPPPGWRAEQLHRLPWGFVWRQALGPSGLIGAGCSLALLQPEERPGRGQQRQQ